MIYLMLNVLNMERVIFCKKKDEFLFLIVAFLICCLKFTFVIIINLLKISRTKWVP